ncbi:MAG: glycosyltransferase family 2 protein [bacterium]|nr:glycosyltransferase family 2 protein [bacterium]
MTTQTTEPDVSIVIPVYNEEECLPTLAAEIRRTMEAQSRSWEVLFIDDGSTDTSPAVLRELAADDSHLRLLRLRRNCGQSAALVAGFRAARAPVVVTLDADLQNDPADIPLLLAELEGSDGDVVSGIRTGRRDRWIRRVSSRIANRVRERVLHDSVTDVGCSLKAYRTGYLRRIPVFNGMHRFLPALVQMAGARVREVAVSHRPRLHGESKYNIRNRLWRALADLMAVRWMQKRWIDDRLVEEIGDAPKGAPP